VSNWQDKHCLEQWVGFLYGYYSEDPSYPDGVRVNIEAIYEPPQYGDEHGFHILEDENDYVIDLLANNLTLERVGWVFTSTDEEHFISPQNIWLIAEMQERYSVQHPLGCKVSKFVTLIVKPSQGGLDTIMESVMVSDQC